LKISLDQENIVIIINVWIYSKIQLVLQISLLN
jgi:hypothetical protein